jgi:hypothetical protein
LKLIENAVKLQKADREPVGVSVLKSEQRTARGTGRKRSMDVLKMLSDLRQEREQIEEAIMTLERLARGRGRRRGRPPAWMSAIKRRGRPPGSKNKAKESAAA